MTPLSFDPMTAREFTGDAEARRLEAKARGDADAQVFDPPRALSNGTYADMVRASMWAIVYREQYTKRLARNKRKKEQAC